MNAEEVLSLCRLLRAERGNGNENVRSRPAQQSPRLIHHISLHAPSLKSLNQALRMSRQLAIVPTTTPVTTTTTHGSVAAHRRPTTPLKPGCESIKAARVRARANSSVQSIELPLIAAELGRASDLAGDGADRKALRLARIPCGGSPAAWSDEFSGVVSL